MNKIYKVIWSKAKHTYVVASEIAKGHTKGETTGRGLKKLAAALLVAAALLSPSFAWAADTVKVEPATDTASTTAVEVYTKEWAEKEISTLSTQIGTNATNNDTNTTNINGLTTRVNALESSKTDTALHISSSGDLIVGTKENQTVKDMEIRGKLTSGSISTGGITSTGDVTVAGKMAADGVTDETTKDGTYIKQNNTVGNNLVSLDTQVKANADAIAEKVNAADVYTKDETDQKVDAANTYTYRKVATEEKAREAADKALDDRITNVKEYLEKQTSDNYVSKADAAVQDGAIVKAANTIGENVTNLDAALAKETAARLGADAAQDKVIKQVNDNLVASVNTINKNVADGFTALNQADANEAAAREAKDNELNERITNEANGIHDEIKAGDKALDDRITNVKEYLEKQTSDTYVSKDDAAVQNGAIVKADKTIGENVTNLDAALAKETAARLGADKAQDKVIETVNQNMVDGFNTINKNMSDGFTALNQADANELAGRMAADTKLVEAVNSGLSLSNDNVLQKNTTAIDDQGKVTTSKTAAKEMILNKGKDNQITLNEKGIKVGTNSSVMDKDGVYTGGDTYVAAKAAMSADGKIKGANGAFTVDENGNVASKATITGETVTDGKGASMSNGTVTGKTLTDGIATITNGNINTSGSITGGTVTSMSNISALGDIHAGGAITGASASIQGALTAGSATITGDLTAGGAIQGKSISDGTATMQNGNLTGVKNLSAETITTSGDATIGGDLTVNGKLNVDEIDLTKSDIVGDNNVTASTKVAAGEIKSYKKAISMKDGSEKESAIDYDENGTSTWAKATDADGNWNKSTLTVEGSDVTSKVIDSEKNSNLSTQTSTQSQSTLTDKDKNTNVSTQTVSESSSVVSGKDGEKTYKSYITQNMKKILQGIKEGTNESIVDQTETGIKSTATDGKNTASTNLSNNGFNTYATDGTNETYTKQTAADITNTAKNGTIANEAKDITNHASENMTNTVGKNLETTVGGEMKTTVTGNVTEDFKADLSTTVGGNKSETVTGTSTETVTGKKTEAYKGGLETTITGDEKHTVNGSQTNSITGDQVNTIGGKQTTTVTGDVTEDYKANLSTTVGGSQTTTVTGDSSLTAENINNTARNKITNKALDVETDAASSIMNKVSNDAGSNTSTQLSYETKEEMSQADGKIASYLRGAAEEKSQLTDGAKKTTIDTVAGQTNTNITEGKNISNSLQKADQAASSVTDGTNTTVVNQDAKSLASSITDGAKANNTNNTVDKSEQLIKVSDTQYSATSKTATKMEDALVSGGSVIDVIKNLDDAANPSIGSAVTDGSNSTGVTQTAKDITNTAKNGTIANEAKDLVNTASENMTNNVGKNLTTTVGGEMKTTVTGKVTEDYKSDLSTKVGGDETHAVTGNQTTTVSGNRTVNVKGTETENFNALETNVKTDQKTSVGGNQTTIVTGNQTNNVSGSKTETVKGSVTEKYGSQATTVDGDQSTNIGGSQTTVVAKDQTNTVSGNKTETVKGAVNETYGSQTTKVNGDQITTVTGKQTNSITGDQVNTIGGNQTTTVTGDSSLSAKNITNTASEKITNQIGDGSAVKSEMTADGITNTAEGGTIYNKSKDILNQVSGDILNFADGEIGNSANKITNLTGDNTVTSDTNGTTFENKAHSTAVKEGTITKTTISGNTITTGEAVMDYADVMKDLGVRGNATVDGNTTLGTDGKDTLTVNSTSTFKEKVTMEKDLNVKSEVLVNEGDKNQVRINTNGITVGLNSTVVDSEGVYVGGHTFEAAKAGMDKDGKLKAASGNFQVDTKGNVSAVSYTVKDTNIKIDNTGINAGSTKVTGLAPADISHAGSTDAVSGGQLYETNTRVSGLETRMGTVETRVDKLDNKIDKVGANAAAMANLHPLEFDEDSKWNIAAAVGSSGSETASAVGVFYRPNENVMVNASAAMGTGENMFGGGVSLRLGHGGNKAKEAQMKAAAAENKELRAKVDDLTARMDALLSVLNPNMSKDFPDVPENHWAYEAVSRLAGNGIVEGYEDGKYHGERQMTRYEMAEIIYNALSKGAKAEKKLVEEFRPELQAMAAQKKA
ncbi:bacteriophage T4 gp5 trimerisation domain-containing protein [Dialister succinatiphilus]|uniref:bacteriophage T4 gp5 trimerisation domain-containing protein n=2 Tax=Dialister succinatiphilus TaxID=487173 RepID=UPI003AB83D2B